MAKDFNKRRIVISGIGSLSSLGIGSESIWKNFVNGKCNVENLSASGFDGILDKFKVYKIKKFSRNIFNFDKKVYSEILYWKNQHKSFDLLYFFSSIQIAIEDSRIKEKDLKRAGLVLTHENPGVEQFCSDVINETYRMNSLQCFKSKSEYFQKLYHKFTKNVNDLQTFIYLYFVGKMFKIQGYSLFVNNSCASGLFALEAAAESIRSGKSEVVVVASSEHPSIYKHLWFKQLGLLSRRGEIRPFAEGRDGFLCGEGGTAIILESLNHARNRGAKIYAEYLGGSFLLDSWKITLPNVSERNYSRTLQAALRNCNLEAGQVDFVCAHGLGSQLLDLYEARSFQEVFKGRGNMPHITAFKQYVGHTLGNCALLEVVLMVLCLKNDFIVPVMGGSSIDSNIKIQLVKEALERRIKIGLKSVWGFGGYNAAAIFKKFHG